MLKYYKENQETIISLLCMFIIELIILIGINLANQQPIYRLLGFAVMCGVLPIIFRKYDRKTYILLGISLAALFLFIIPSGISPLTSKMGNIERFSILFGTIPFFIFGIFIALIDVKKKSIKYIILAIYSSLSIFTLISLIITIIDYGSPFYYISYRKDNLLIEIINYADAFIGLNKRTTRIESLSNFGLVCSTALGVSVFLKKEDKKTFFITLLCGIIGVVTVIFLFTALDVYALIIYCIVLIAVKFWNNPRFHKLWYFFAFIILVTILVTLRFIYRFDPNVQNFLDKTYILKELIVPRLGLSERLSAIKYALSQPSLFGNGNYKPTGMRLFDVLQLDGILAALGLLVLFILSIYGVLKYVKKSNSSLKFGIASLLLILLFIFNFNDYRILTIFDTRPTITMYYYPISLDILFIPFLVLSGYTLFFIADIENTKDETKLN